MKSGINQNLVVAGTLLLGLCGLAVEGQAYRRQCRDDWECASAAGEMCWWQYDGCELGQCMCNPYTHDTGTGGACVLKIRGGDRCFGGDVCPLGMACREERCVCTNGKLTADRLFCLHGHQRLIGEECTPFEHTCLQQAAPGLSPYAYSETNVACSRGGVCDCVQGFKRQANSCVHYELGAVGCRESYHCQGGALCFNRTCVCPAGYQPAAHGTKCARTGATTEVRMRHGCDELNERRYCAEGLVCHQCAGKTHNTCVRYIRVAETGAFSSSAAVRWPYKSLLPVIATFSLTLLVL